MKIKIIAFCFCVLVLGSIPCSAAPRDYSYFGGVNLTWHDRLAAFDLGNSHEQKENRPLLFSTGLTLGKRLILPLHFRLSLPVLFDYGSVNEDTLKKMALENGTTPDVVLESSFYHIGVSPEIQFVLPTENELKLFFSIGGGIHYVFLQQDEMAGKTRIIDPQYIENFGGIRWSVCGGLGADLIILQHFGLEFQYLFRYWHPVKGTTDKELFPLGNVEYKERFFSHGFAVSVLINRGD